MCMGCQDESFQIGRKHCNRSLSQHITQNFLPWLDRWKCQKQIRRLLDTSIGSVAATVSCEATEKCLAQLLRVDTP